MRAAQAIGLLALLLVAGCSGRSNRTGDNGGLEVSTATQPPAYFFDYSESWQSSGAQENHRWTIPVQGTDYVNVVVSYQGTAPTFQSGDHLGSLSITITTAGVESRYTFTCEFPQTAWGCMSQQTGPLVAPANPGTYQVVLASANKCAEMCGARSAFVEIRTQDAIGVFTVEAVKGSAPEKAT